MLLVSLLRLVGFVDPALPVSPPFPHAASAPGPRPLDDNPECDWPVVPADAVDVTDFGATADDGVPDTAAFTAAVAAAGVGGTVTVPAGQFDIEGDYEPSRGAFGFELLDDQTLSMDEDTVLAVVPNALENYSVIRVEGVSGVTIAGGTILGDRDTHLGTTGEWGMGVDIRSATRVSVRRVRAEGLWGDGFYVSGSQFGPPSRTITLCGVVASNNRRQGLSVTNGVNVVVEDSEFSDTEGTLPEAGIDLEPDDYELVRDVRLSHNLFSGNRTGIYLTAIGGVDQGPIDCVVEDNLVEDSREQGISLSRGTGNTVQNNTVRRSGTDGIMVSWYEPFVVTGNTVEDSTESGLLVEAQYDWVDGEVSGHQISENTIERSGGNGIWVLWVHEIELSDNVVSDSAEGGIVLNTASRNLVEANTVSNSAGAAQLEIEVGSGNTLRANTIAGATSAYGIWLHNSPTVGNKLIRNVLTGGYTDRAIRDQGRATRSVGNVN